MTDDREVALQSYDRLMTFRTDSIERPKSRSPELISVIDECHFLAMRGN